MIPKIIWQTYKDPLESLPKYMKDAIETWKNLNPEYEYKYMDDSQAAEFVKKFYGQDMYDLFMSFPVGVMRGDLWRYLIIYAYGGVYADLDTLCKQPIESWLKPEYDMIVCPEHDLHFCQWAFAASKNNSIIKSVIDLVVERNKKPNYNIPHFIHYYTGPGVWTSGILKELGLEENNHKCDEQSTDGRCRHARLIDNSIEYNEYKSVKNKKFYCYGGQDWRIFHHTAIHHLYGSQNWHEGYVQWIQEPLAKKSR